MILIIIVIIMSLSLSKNQPPGSFLSRKQELPRSPGRSDSLSPLVTNHDGHDDHHDCHDDRHDGHGHDGQEDDDSDDEQLCQRGPGKLGRAACDKVKSGNS